MNKRIAFSKVVMPSGETCRREVVEFDENGKPIRHFPLVEEIPFVEWHDQTYLWPDTL